MQNAKTLQALTDKLWEEYCEIFPRLVRFDSPTLKVNNRLTKTAGRCFFEENFIDLGGKFLAQHESTMLRVILPHEIAHQIDYNLNGWHTRKPFHGSPWVKIMVKIGQEPNPYHSMELKK